MIILNSYFLIVFTYILISDENAIRIIVSIAQKRNETGVSMPKLKILSITFCALDGFNCLKT